MSGLPAILQFILWLVIIIAAVVLFIEVLDVLDSETNR